LHVLVNVFVTEEAVGPWVAYQERHLRTYRGGSNRVVGCDQYLVTDDSAWLERVLLEVADECELGADADAHTLGFISQSQHATEAEAGARAV
jgi:hypothetical protein